MPTQTTRSDVARRLGIQHAVVQGPFGGGLSTARLAATVSNLGGLGSFGAHALSPDALGATASAIRALTRQPFALNLWISNADPGGRDPDENAWAAALERVAPFFRELSLPLPSRPTPEEIAPSYEEQVEALLEARPPVFSFVFGVPSRMILEACRVRGIVTWVRRRRFARRSPSTRRGSMRSS